MVNPFDPKAVLLAKHAQHVVLIHFPIALFISAVGFDAVAQWTKGGKFADVAYYNLLIAAVSTVPAVVTGLMAWQFQLEGQRLNGVLLAHLLLALLSTMLVWLSWFLHFRAGKQPRTLSSYRFVLEFAGVAVIAMTGHLGGFLSGVNLPT
jgi:uncharacterized membrane protein